MADDNIRKEFEELKTDFNHLREDIASLVEALQDAGMDKVSEAKAGLGEQYAERREKLRAALNRARTRGDEAMDDIEQSISEHPLSSLAMAFGLGFIIAKLMEGRRH